MAGNTPRLGEFKSMEPIFSDIHQIGLVVKNVKETIKNYTENYGIGPWNVWEFNADMVKDMEVRGKRLDYSMMVATCKSCNVDWEIVQPLDDKSIYSEFYSMYGEGLQHINYIVKDYSRAKEHLIDRGVEVIQYGNLVGKHIFIYFGTEHDAKHIMETSTNLPGFKRREPHFVYHAEDEKNKVPKPIFNRIEQVGIVVKDIKKTAATLQDKYILGPWEFFKFNPSTVKDMHVSGKNQNHSFDTAICKIGGIQLKLVKPNDDKSIFSKHLSRFGEGLHHVCFSVNDLDMVSEKIKSQGKKTMQSGNWHGQKYAYFSTENDLKFTACFYEEKESFKRPDPYYTYLFDKS